MNSVEQHIADTGNCRWAYKNAEYYWFVGGETDDPALLSQMRYRITRDMSTLGARCLRQRRQPVALITATQASPLILQMLAKYPGWKSVQFGVEGLAVTDPDSVAANTADVVLCYGTPSERLLEILEAVEKGPELIRRKIGYADRLRMPVKTKGGGDPYSRFWTDVDRLRHWRPNPMPGLNIRDEIDMRPKFDV